MILACNRTVASSKSDRDIEATTIIHKTSNTNIIPIPEKVIAIKKEVGQISCSYFGIFYKYQQKK